jgi:hypothetical protein
VYLMWLMRGLSNRGCRSHPDFRLRAIKLAARS